MHNTNLASNEQRQGSTGIITHRVLEGKQEEYEHWLNQIAPVCRSYPGHLDLQIIRPIPRLTHTYTIVIRFDTHEHLHQWITSKDRKGFIENVTPLLCKGDEVTIKSGLDFWFTPQEAQAKLPKRWKQFLVTWSAIVPLNILAAVFLVPLFNHTNLELRVVIVSGVVVLLMVYVVMPRYTKLVQKWLFD